MRNLTTQQKSWMRERKSECISIPSKKKASSTRYLSDIMRGSRGMEAAKCCSWGDLVGFWCLLSASNWWVTEGRVHFLSPSRPKKNFCSVMRNSWFLSNLCCRYDTRCDGGFFSSHLADCSSARYRWILIRNQGGLLSLLPNLSWRGSWESVIWFKIQKP